MAGSADDDLAVLVGKRKIIAALPASQGRDAILRALGDVIVKLETGRWPDSP